MEKDDLNGTFPFAGLTRFSEGEVPHDAWGHGSSMRWWASEHTGNGEADPANLPDEGFITQANQLPRATTATAGWKHPITGDFIETGKHNAIVNPRLVEDVDTAFVIYNFDSDEAGDGGAATDHLIANPALSQTRDIGSIDTLTVSAGDLTINLD